MRIGILGGSFDPVHVGHLLIAQDAREKLHLDRVLFLLAARPPHKQCVLSYAARRDLLKRAIRGHPGFVLSEIEADRSGLSYTVESLALLKARHRDDSLVLLVGADQFAELRTWKQPERLSDYAEIAVMTRPGTRIGVPRRKSSEFRTRNSKLVTRNFLLPVREIEISSSEIRSRIRAGLPVADMLPDSVFGLIRRRRLYTKTGQREKG